MFWLRGDRAGLSPPSTHLEAEVNWVARGGVGEGVAAACGLAFVQRHLGATPVDQKAKQASSRSASPGFQAMQGRRPGSNPTCPALPAGGRWPLDCSGKRLHFASGRKSGAQAPGWKQVRRRAHLCRSHAALRPLMPLPTTATRRPSIVTIGQLDNALAARSPKAQLAFILATAFWPQTSP